MKDPLKNTVIAISGDFGKERTRKQLKQWIEVNGGKCANGISGEVTHLICSEADYKNNADAVRLAMITKIHIVSYDWLEDSIMKRRDLSPRTYLWPVIIKKQEKENGKRERKEATKLSKDVSLFLNGCKEATKDIFSGESDLAKKSMNRLVLDSFMTNMDTKKTRGKATKTTKTSGKPKAAKTHKVVKKTTASKRDTKAKDDEHSTVTDADLDDNGYSDIIGLSTTTTKPKKRRPRARKHISYDEDGAPYHNLVIPTADPTQIIRGVTDQEMQTNLLNQANQHWPFPDNHHVYRDPSSGLDFAVILVRINIEHNNGGERIFLRLYESNTEPHTYAAYMRHEFQQVKQSTQLASLGSSFEQAFMSYADAFENHTFVKWADRERARAVAGGRPRNVKKFVRSDGSEVEEMPYSYMKMQPMT